MMVSKLSVIEVEWYEGLRIEGFDDPPFSFGTWSEFQDFLTKVYNENSRNSGTYNKVKFTCNWANGDFMVDRIDVGESPDYNPLTSGPVGLYLKNQTSAMYGSSFTYETDNGKTVREGGKITSTTRDSVAWTDEQSKEAADDKKVVEVTEAEYPMLIALYHELGNLAERLDW